MTDRTKLAECAEQQIEDYKALLDAHVAQSQEVVSESSWLWGLWTSQTTKENLGLSVPLDGKKDGTSLAERLATSGAGALYAACMQEIEVPATPQTVAPKALRP